MMGEKWMWQKLWQLKSFISFLRCKIKFEMIVYLCVRLKDHNFELNSYEHENSNHMTNNIKLNNVLPYKQ